MKIFITHQLQFETQYYRLKEWKRTEDLKGVLSIN